MPLKLITLQCILEDAIILKKKSYIRTKMTRNQNSTLKKIDH